MMTKCLIVLVALVAVCSAGIVPAAVPAALTVGTYATSYNAHAINHAIAAPYTVAAAPYTVAAAAPLTYSAAYPALSAYSAYPYSAYAAAPYYALRR
ncbi:hypothetical protein TSAR_015384 [Trichomalopsis sarcophagae]|uniref:Uncharacterized protein n=1 Tax=Trichomalopsis sarcophagae TaxID=543379 RepID=A0A232ESS7_9HYME|nr:hypothetical protein TSAR_015384 [Trichomalopsis sarcophagae]